VRQAGGALAVRAGGRTSPRPHLPPICRGVLRRHLAVAAAAGGASGSGGNLRREREMVCQQQVLRAPVDLS
jgi:hypothetical protein